MEKEITVREWIQKWDEKWCVKDNFESGPVGWYDWFCRDSALYGRTSKLAKVISKITNPEILDNFYVWFKNNCRISGGLYDDIRFEPLDDKLRGDRYFLISYKEPGEAKKWNVYRMRDGEVPNVFSTDSVNELVKYINGMKF